MVNEKSLKAALVRSDAIFHNSHDGIIAINAESEIAFINNAAREMFGVPENEDLIGERVELLMDDAIAHAHAGFVANHMKGMDSPIMDQLRRIQAKRISGELFPIDIHVFHLSADGERHYVAFIRDMTEIEEKELELNQIAYFDSLTGLPNASSFRDFLKDLYALDIVPQHLIAILGIDHMRMINSSFGFEEGDEVISVVARRLEVELSDAAFFGRLFGDQFVCAIELNHDQQPVEVLNKIGKRVSMLFDAPIQVTDARVSASITIGAISVPDLAPSLELVAKHAEMAFGEAKVASRSQWHFLSQERLDALEFSASLTHKLMDAIQSNEFAIVIQPKIDVRFARPSGGEVLVRWNPRNGPPIRPDIFIPAAENAGLIGAIGRFVFLESCSTMVQARMAGLKPTKLAVNTSPHQLAEPGFFDLIERTLDDMEIDPKHLEFEMTETAVAENPEVVKDTLNKLRSIGCSIALDDFGTGHSSLTMLQDIPIDRVKLDKAFVDKLDTHARSFSLVENSIKMMRDMGFLVTVEGIETREVHDLLYALGVDEAQGYFYSKPLPPQEFLDFKFDL